MPSGIKQVFGVRSYLGRENNQGIRVMELDKISLFGVIKKRLAWLGQRHEVVAQNIANADTPNYKARDIEAFKFRDLVRRQGVSLRMATTESNHLKGVRKRATDFTVAVESKPFETSPTGNSVVLEEQMANMSENGISHRLTTELYKKHLNMFRIAVRGR